MTTSAEPTGGPPACPHCGGATVPIAYGLPGPDLFKQARRGEVALGGCVVWDDMPRHRCSACRRDIGGTPEEDDASSAERP